MNKMEFLQSRNRTGDDRPIRLEKFNEIFHHKQQVSSAHLNKRLSITSAKNDNINI